MRGRKNYRLQDIQLSKNAWLTAFGREPRNLLPAFVTTGGRRLVENTGLEPVTSWLQTRRSPS